MFKNQIKKNWLKRKKFGFQRQNEMIKNIRTLLSRINKE